MAAASNQSSTSRRCPPPDLARLILTDDGQALLRAKPAFGLFSPVAGCREARHRYATNTAAKKRDPRRSIRDAFPADQLSDDQGKALCQDDENRRSVQEAHQRYRSASAAAGLRSFECHEQMTNFFTASFPSRVISWKRQGQQGLRKPGGQS